MACEAVVPALSHDLMQKVQLAAVHAADTSLAISAPLARVHLPPQSSHDLQAGLTHPSSQTTATRSHHHR